VIVADAKEGIPGLPLAFFDSHAHLVADAFDADRDEVVRAAGAAGAVGVICIGESQRAAADACALAVRYPGFVFSTAGVHPHDAASYDTARDRDWIVAAVGAGAVAIGECGLDYHYDHSPRDRQRQAFADQLALAATVARPIIVHTRDAEADTRAMLRDAAHLGVTGVLHCFTGSRELAEAALDVGWYVSFSGIVTFGKWGGDGIVRAIPGDRLLVETDAPYLAPVPHRGHRNEPRFVPLIVARLATVRGETPDAVASATTRNARQLFGLATNGSL
jgi:TatD DNase family protein